MDKIREQKRLQKLAQDGREEQFGKLDESNLEELWLQHLAEQMKKGKEAGLD